MASRGGLSALALAEIAAGVILAWSGIENASISVVLGSLIRGQAPTPGTGSETISTVSASDPGGPGAPVGSPPASTSAIAAAAAKYNGHSYLYGGHPGPSGTGPWDCSSFVSWVLGHDLGMSIPGGSWAKVTDNGNVHGPTTVSYLSWSGAQTIGHSASVARPGDLLVWQTHIGICTSSNEMISAQDEALGTGYASISGAIPGELLFVRRVTLATAAAA